MMDKAIQIGNKVYRAKNFRYSGSKKWADVECWELGSWNLIDDQRQIVAAAEKLWINPE